MPQLSITAAFTRALASFAGSKRKHDEVDEGDDGYDSDEIQVSTARPRPPLQTVPTAQAQNKRVRVLDCVLIPAPKRATEQTTLPRAAVPSARNITTTARNAQTPQSSRSRQANARLEHEDISDDELIVPTEKPKPKPRLKPKTGKAASKAQVNEDSDFEDAIRATESEAFSASESEGVSSDISMDDASDGDEEDSKVKPKSTTKNKSATSTRVTSGKTGANNKSKKASAKCMANLISRDSGFARGLNLDSRPLHGIEDIFEDMTAKAFKLDLSKALQHFGGKQLRVATMCSGTESPLLALEMIRDSVKRQSEYDLTIDHAFSAEIVPFKQAYIERNFNPPLIFRDITELTDAVKDETPMATTAYGSKARVPTDIHMVIAGTSCVDFSNLNKHKKRLEDEGESGKTWEAVLSFCSAFKPPIVLLENVKNAAWDKMQEQFRSIGYEAAGVHVDTKNYYLPQTRQRGYMVCFDAARVKAAGLSAPTEKWRSLMSKFQRYCSSPATSFLLPSDSLSKQNHGIADDNKREIDWVKCAERHVRYRQEKRLGTKRPLTYWQESGSMIVPENGVASWYHDQVERVLDLMDCSLLRKANSEMYDVRFKTRIWDVSQNVDVNEDNPPFGIASCITPTGQVVASDGGRQLSAQENLKLQGIPLSKILLTTETARELQDLAGNAMSSTVIGSAILSALLAGHQVVSDFSGPDTSSLARTIAHPGINAFEEASSIPVHYDHDSHDLSSLWDIAERAIRRCYCEGGSAVTRKDLQRCSDCGHTTCTACGGNPSHNYRHDQSLSKGRMLPSDAEETIRSKLPLQVKFANIRKTIDSLRASASKSKIADRYLDMVGEAANEVFSLHGFRRAGQLTVTFESQYGQSHLELVLHEDHAEWQLFVHASKDLAANDALRKALRQPVAKSRISHSLFDGQWNWRLPSTKSISLTIHGSGEEVPTWWSRIGLPDFRHHKQPRNLKVTSSEAAQSPLTAQLIGTYEYLPRCGTACDSLYKQIDDASPAEGPMFLFLDPTRVGAPDEDFFVFSKDHERLDYDEKRAIDAEVEASWRPWKHRQEERTVTAKVDDWIESELTGTLQPLSTVLEMREPTVRDSLTQEHSCSQPTELIACFVGDSPSPPASHWELVHPQDSRFFSQNAWLFEAIRRSVRMDKWSPVEMGAILEQCAACAPKKPELKWKLSDKGDFIKPYEDSTSAAEYERAIKSRPTAMAVEAKLSPESQGKASQVRLGVNIVSMVHRVRALLPSSIADVAYSWRLRPESTSSNNYSFKPFNLKALSQMKPYSTSLDMTIQLFPNQQKSLAWMRQQESGSGRSFHIEEAVEEKLDQLGWALEMRARAPVHVRGGICADHPGYGKTIASLALVQAQLQDQSSKQVIQELNQRQHGNAAGFMPSAATVILCPRTLVDQWAEEASEKLGFKLNTDILTFKKDSDFDKKTPEQLSLANLIIISTNVIGSESYLERLAALAGVPGPAAAKGRAFEEWLDYALALIPDKIKILQQSGRNELRRHAQESYSANVNSEHFKAAVPSRRLRGKDYVAAQKKKSSVSLTKFAAPKSLDTSLVGNPLLHMFYLNRVICDEFHNYDPRELALIRALKKDKIWGLSGTPPTGDFCDIARMGQLLGIDLPIGAHSRGVMKQKNIQQLRKEMTDFERFDSMRQPVSKSILARTNELLQEFLDAFVTRNLTDFKMDFQDHLVPVELDLDHRSVYTEVSQYLNSIEMRLKKSSKSKTTDREERLSDVTATSETAEEALSKLAAYFDREDLAMGSSEPGLKDLIDRRREETREREESLRTAIQKAEKGETVVFEQWRQGRLHLDNLGDQETLDAVLSSCSKSDKESKELAATKLPSGQKHDTSEGLTSTVNAMVSRLLVSKRSLRFVENLSRVHKLSDKQAHKSICAKEGCRSGSVNIDIGVSAFCGHTICQTCYQQQKERGDAQCAASDCHAPINDHEILWRSRIKDLQRSKKGSFGAKIDATVKLLKTISDQGDQAVLFVQFDKQLDDIDQALRHHKIPAAFVESTKSSKPIEEFKSDSGITVMVLNASDETATGLNLQNANHVIFLSPLLRDQQYAYDATMAQAIGRVRRHGQQKEIHVYRIVALDTIDVDILEHRERRTNALTEQGAPVIEPFSHVEVEQVIDEVKPEHTQLVKENGVFSLRPQSWLMRCGPDEDEEELGKIRNEEGSTRILHEQRVKMKGRVMGWENFTSLIKFSRAHTEDDD